MPNGIRPKMAGGRRITLSPRSDGKSFSGGYGTMLALF